MRTRARIALLAAALAAPAGGGTASACINIHVAPSVGSAGPGDPVGFTISTLVPGAQYTVSVGGHAVASGVATAEFAAGTFAMPNLGKTSFSTVIAAVVAHEDIEQSPWTTTAPLVYEAAVVAPAAPQTHTKKTTAPPPPVHAPPPAAKHPAAAKPPARTVPRPASVPAPAAHPKALRSHRAVRKTRALVAVRTLPKRELREPPAARIHVTVIDVRAPQHTPWPLALALLLLACVPPAAAYALRRRTRNPPPPDEVEAELQEIIAEERARERARL